MKRVIFIRFLFEQITFEKKAIGNFYLLESKAGSDTECQACKDAAAMVVPLVVIHGMNVSQNTKTNLIIHIVTARV